MARMAMVEGTSMLPSSIPSYQPSNRREEQGKPLVSLHAREFTMLAAHVEALHAAHSPLRHVPKPRLGLADVPVLLGQRHAERLALRAPRLACGGRGRVRLRRGQRRLA